MVNDKYLSGENMVNGICAEA